MRSLSAEEAALWAKVAATIKPLSRDRKTEQAIDLKSKTPSVETAAKVASKPTSEPPKRTAPAPVRPGTNLDGSWDKKLRSGSVVPDRVLDLHGMTLDRAWTAIDRGLERSIASGDRVLLLITGHARPSDPPVQRGRIRAAVHDWLAASRHAASLAAVRNAHPRHGGGGSLYIILRRRGRP